MDYRLCSIVANNKIEDATAVEHITKQVNDGSKKWERN